MKLLLVVLVVIQAIANAMDLSIKIRNFSSIEGYSWKYVLNIDIFKFEHISLQDFGICVSSSLSYDKYCSLNNLNSIKYSVRKMKQQIVTVSLCKFESNTLDECIASDSIEIFPMYPPKCIQNFKYDDIKVIKENKKSQNTEIFAYLHCNLGNWLSELERVSFVSLLESIDYFYNISGSYVPINAFNINFVLQHCGNNENSNYSQFQNLVEMTIARFKLKPNIFAFACSYDNDDCTLSVISEKSDKIVDDEIIIVVDLLTHRYKKEAVADMIDSIDESNPCLSLFTLGDLDPSSALRVGNLFHYTVGIRRPTRWCELPFMESYSDTWPFLDKAKDFSMKMETFIYLISQYPGPKNSLSDFINWSSKLNVPFVPGGKLPIIYPWPSASIFPDDKSDLEYILDFPKLKDFLQN